MKMFEFTLVVEGIDLADPEHVDALLGGGCDDAMPIARDGVTMLAFARDAESAELALCSSVDDVERAVPGAIVIELEADLVSTPDVAERVGRTRESVRLLVEGKRGPGGFPSPVGWVGDGIRVWRWADVHAWCRRHLDFDDDAEPIDATTATLFNSTLAERRRDLVLDLKVRLLHHLRSKSLVHAAPVAVAASVSRASTRYRVLQQSAHAPRSESLAS